MVSYIVRIGIRKFSSVAEADRFYHAILHSTEPGNEVQFKEAKDVLSLALFDGTMNGLLGKHFCNVISVRVITNRFGKKLFYILLESGKSFKFSLKELVQVVRKDAAKAYGKRNNIRIVHKKLPLSPEKLWKRHLLAFRYACRRLAYKSSNKPKVDGLEAHHANPGGLEFIITSFIVLNNLDFYEKLVERGVILDEALREKFLEYHNQRVMWEMVDHGTHLSIHREQNREKN